MASTLKYTYAQAVAGTATQAEAATTRRAHDLKYPEAGTAAPQQMPGWVAGVAMKGGARDIHD